MLCLHFLTPRGVVPVLLLFQTNIQGLYDEKLQRLHKNSTGIYSFKCIPYLSKNVFKANA